MQKYFETITDPRQKWKIDYPLLEIIIMAIWAVISSCEEWEEIEDFCKVNIDWFRTKVGLKLKEDVAGVASYHTFKRVFQIINPEELEKCFYKWVKNIADFTSGEDWANLKSIEAVVSTVVRNDKTTSETRYFISTLTDVETFAKAVRGHWDVENTLHWMFRCYFQRR